ncbi:MAG: hypothetical protein JW996_03850, partial [Candidatus Cloacimonetes bacterium]|nr:hypothetical protein [Candidatus Cloacimonadota bacterium]
MKKNCRFSNKLQRFVLKELNQHEYQQVQKHLLNCTLCQQEINQLLQLDQFMKEFREQKPADDIITQLIKKTRGDNITFSKGFNLLSVKGFAAAACTLLAIYAGIQIADLSY